MSYNHGIEEKRFKGRWEQQEKHYRKNGMSDEQIAALRKFDEECFKQDRAFYRRTTLVAEPEHLSEGTADELLIHTLRNTGSSLWMMKKDTKSSWKFRKS